MKPLKLRPAFKDYVWGGTKLNEVYHKNSGFARTAESWEISTHPDGLSVIDGGEHDGQTLAAYIAANPSVLGTQRLSDELPILVKLIDAEDNLSVQVHPNDEQARAWENQNGKTELWYVVQADADARIVFGVKEGVTAPMFAQAIRDNTTESLLNSVPSQQGDSFFVEAGTVHAIGKGNLIAEVQQNSNVTYRLYDYGRRDKNGQPRQLHIDKGLRAAVFDKRPIAPTMLTEQGRLLGQCAYFTVWEQAVKDVQLFTQTTAGYRCLLVTDGSLSVDDVSLAAGDAVFLPACDTERVLKGCGTVLHIAPPQM